MNRPPDPLDDYLDRLAGRLAPLGADAVRDIVAEVRSHVLESIDSGLEAPDSLQDQILSGFGSPDALAAAYLRDDLLRRASRSRSPRLLLVALLPWARRSALGAIALLALIAGYTISASLVLAALRDPFAPDRVGLWRTSDDAYSLRLGFGDLASGSELLGAWIIPIGLVVGTALAWLTTLGARATIRRLRTPPLAIERGSEP